MLFHVTYTHTPQLCPSHDPERLRATFGKILGSAEEIGVKLVGLYADAPAHTTYWILETDSAEKLDELFDPGLDIGHAEIRPVVRGLGAYRKLLIQK